MNKTVNINLAGIFFHIDEDAYTKLQRYLEAIKRSFTDSQGRSEIISDIEARIAELFSERMKTDRQVIGNNEVEQIITIMGQPEDYIVDDEIFEDEPTQKSAYKASINNSKKLFRDTENSYIGGVASGLSYYFNIDIVWIRLIWILLVFGAGTGIFLYILLWVFIPEANSTAEKLTMTGEEVTITNIEKKIKDGFESVSENVKNIDFQKHADKLKEGLENATDSITDTVKRLPSSKIKSTSKTFFESLGDAFMLFLKLFSKFIGGAIIISCIAGIIALSIGLVFGPSVNANFSFINLDSINTRDLFDEAYWVFPLLIFIVSVIPIIFFLYLGLKILVNNLKPMGNVAKYSLIGLWIMAIIGLSIIATKQGLRYKEKAASIYTEPLPNIKTSDTLVISMNYNDTFAERFRRDYGLQRTNADNGEEVTFSQGIRLIIKSTKDNVAKIRVDKSARGSSFNDAKDRAKDISYNYTLEGNTLLLDNYFTIPNNAISRDQEIELTVYLPEGSVLFAEKSTYNYHRNNSNYYNDILNNGMEEQYLLVKRNKLECLDCPEDDKDETTSAKETLNNETSNLKINENGLEANTKNMKLKVNDEGLKASTKNIDVSINEEQGVNITSKKK